MSKSRIRGIVNLARDKWKPALLLIVITMVAYGPALVGGFVCDDDVFVKQNPLITEPGGLGKIWSIHCPLPYFPLTYTSFYLEYRLWGLNPAGYHLINVLLQAASALLLWHILNRLRVPGAWLAAAIFAIHPVQVESVAWISERKNVLMGFFFLLTICAWLPFIDERTARPWRYYVLSLIIFGLALAAKPTACTLPTALLLIVWLKKMPISWQRIAQIAPYVVMGLGMGLISMWWEHHYHDTEGIPFKIGEAERLLIASRAIWFYLAKLFWPVDLTIEYSRWTVSASDSRAYLWIASTALASALIWSARARTGRGVEVAALYFVTTLGPMLGFIMHGMYKYSFVADHFQYLACIGPIALASAGISELAQRLRTRTMYLIFNSALLITLGILTWNQAKMYATPEAFWETTLKRNPDSLMANGSLGTTALNEGRSSDAAAYYLRALRTRPNYDSLHYDLGLAYFTQGKWDDAVSQFNMEIDVNSNYTLAYNNLGKALEQKGRVVEAISAYNRALAIDPDLAEANDNLGMAFLKQGKLDEAISYLQKAEKIEPRFTGEERSLGIALARKGRWAEAITHLQKALEIDGADAEAADNLAWLLATAPETAFRNGMKALELAEQLHRDSALHLQTLAAAQAESGNYKDALITARHAIELAEREKNKRLIDVLESEISFYKNSALAHDAPSRWQR